MVSNKPGKVQDGGQLDEAEVLADIRYFESRIAAFDEIRSPRDAASVQVYRLLLRQRRQLLAAIRDGAPERWPEYAQQTGASGS